MKMNTKCMEEVLKAVEEKLEADLGFMSQLTTGEVSTFLGKNHEGSCEATYHVLVLADMGLIRIKGEINPVITLITYAGHRVLELLRQGESFIAAVEIVSGR